MCNSASRNDSQEHSTYTLHTFGNLSVFFVGFTFISYLADQYTEVLHK